MLRIFYVFSLLLSVVNVNKEIITKVEKIEYFSENYVDNILKLNIVLKSFDIDIVELKVYFYNEEKELMTENYYSSSLIIDGVTTTSAKIPLNNKNKTFLNIIIISNNYKKEITNIMFPIYPKEKSTCDLNTQSICKSRYPVNVIYQDERIVEKYEKVFLGNTSLKFYSFNNLVPLEKINIISDLSFWDGYISINLGNYLDLENKYVPLNLIKSNNFYNFEFSSKYYLDLICGKTYDNYSFNTIADNQIILPYDDREYVFEIEMHNCFRSFDYVKIKFNVLTTKQLIGLCSTSKYCIRRSYI